MIICSAPLLRLALARLRTRLRRRESSLGANASLFDLDVMRKKRFMTFRASSLGHSVHELRSGILPRWGKHERIPSVWGSVLDRRPSQGLTASDRLRAPCFFSCRETFGLSYGSGAAEMHEGEGEQSAEVPRRFGTLGGRDPYKLNVCCRGRAKGVRSASFEYTDNESVHVATRTPSTGDHERA